MTFTSQYQNLLFNCTIIREIKICLPKACIKLYDYMRERIPKAIELYEKSQRVIPRRCSKNLLYFELLERDLDIEYSKLLTNHQYSEKFF